MKSEEYEILKSIGSGAFGFVKQFYILIFIQRFISADTNKKTNNM